LTSATYLAVFGARKAIDQAEKIAKDSAATWCAATTPIVRAVRQFDGALAKMLGLGDVLHRDVASGRDRRYFDMQVRLRTPRRCAIAKSC
jgi:hypothetical protein